MLALPPAPSPARPRTLLVGHRARVRRRARCCSPGCSAVYLVAAGRRRRHHRRLAAQGRRHPRRRRQRDADHDDRRLRDRPVGGLRHRPRQPPRHDHRPRRARRVRRRRRSTPRSTSTTRWASTSAPTSYSTLVYAITGTFLVALVFGIVFAVLMAFRELGGRYSAKDHDGISSLALYWYFLTVAFAGVWFVIYIARVEADDHHRFQVLLRVSASTASSPRSPTRSASDNELLGHRRAGQPRRGRAVPRRLSSSGLPRRQRGHGGLPRRPARGRRPRSAGARSCRPACSRSSARSAPALLVLGLVFDRWMVWAGAVRAGRRHRRVDGAVLVGPGLRRRRVQPRRSASRLMQPFEFPILGALAVGLVVFGFSRVMLSLTKNAAVVVFIVVARLVAGRGRRSWPGPGASAARCIVGHAHGRRHHRAHRRASSAPSRASGASTSHEGEGAKGTESVADVGQHRRHASTSPPSALDARPR